MKLVNVLPCALLPISVAGWSTKLPSKINQVTHLRLPVTVATTTNNARVSVTSPSSSITLYSSLNNENEMDKEEEVGKAKSYMTTEEINKDPIFDIGTTLTLLAGQSTLILVSIVAAYFLHIPNGGLGASFALNLSSIKTGLLSTLPLFGLAAFLDLFEDKISALKDVTRATQRSVLALLGSNFKPVIALVTAMTLGAAAGIGEEMVFRGVLQFELANKFGSTPLALVGTSVIFGLLHAVTPLYALLASVASLFFGYLFIVSDYNLAIPIITHGIYDVGALMWAHFTVTKMPLDQQMELLQSGSIQQEKN